MESCVNNRILFNLNSAKTANEINQLIKSWIVKKKNLIRDQKQFSALVSSSNALRIDVIITTVVQEEMILQPSNSHQ